MTTITVNSTIEAQAAYEQLVANGGGTILLAAADKPYDLILKGEGAGLNSPDILIKPEAPDSNVKLSKVELTYLENVTVRDVSVDTSEVPGSETNHNFDLNKVDNVKILDSTFQGRATDFYDASFSDDEKSDTLGNIHNSTNVEFSGNLVHGYFHGLGIFESIGVTLADNDISGLQADGIRMGGVQDVTIKGNYIHDFYGSPNERNHDDMIQMWSANANLVSRDITIIDNVLHSNDGVATQSIFLGNERDGNDPTHVYDNITVSNNLIINAHANGIAVSAARNVVVENNTLLWNSTAKMYQTPEDYLSGDGANFGPKLAVVRTETGSVKGNIARSIDAHPNMLGENRTVSFTDQTADNYVDKFFLNGMFEGIENLADFRLAFGSDYAGFGADISQARSSTEEGVEAILDLSVAPDDFHHIILDARNSIDTEGFLGAGDRFVWTFSDGTTAEGIVIEKVFDASGAKSVKLDVIRDGQLVDTLNRDFNIADKTLVELSFEDGIVDTSGYSNRLDQVVSDNLIETATGQGYRIGDNEKLLINRSAEQIHNLETFGVRMEMQVTNPGQPGTFLYFHNVFRASVIDDGFVEFKLTTDTGVYSIRSDQALFQDTETHTIGIGFDGVNGTLELVYDGEVVGQTEAYGTTAPQASFGIVFGHAFSAALPAVVEDFVLSSDPSEAGVVIERVNDSFVSNFLAGEAEPEIVPTSIAEETPTNDYTQVASDAGVEAILDLSVAPDDFHHIILDARNSIDTEGFLGAGDRFVWTFSDGTTAEGIVIEKVFDASGAKSVKLDVIRDGQLVDTLNRDFNIADKTLVELSFEDGIVDTSGYSNRLDQVVSDNLIETATGQGYRIGDNEKLLINRSAEQIHNLETFGVRMEMQVTNPGQPGTFLYFHNVFRASVIDDGFVEFKLTTDTGVYSIRSDQALFQDTETHTIGIGFDGVNGTLELVYDGEVVGQTEAYGTTAPQASFGIVFGHAFSAALPAVVEDFVLSSDPSEAGVVIERVNDSFVSNFLAGEAEPEIVPTSIAEETPTNDYTQVASDAGVEAILDLSVAPDDFHHIILDARNSIDTEGFLGAGDRFVWTFSDGTTAEGIVIEKVFDASGAKSVKLDVIRDGQLVDTLNRDFNIADKTLVELSFEDGIVDTSGYSNRLDQVVSDNLIETATGQGYRIGDNEKLLINRSAEQIHNLETFGVRMEMQVTNPGQPGTFLYFHNVFRASVIDDGFVEFKLTTDTGVYSIRSDQALFQDTETHTIGIGFDGVNGTLELVYDGEVVGQTEAYGTTAPQASFGIVFGHAFSAALPAVVEDFVLSSDPSEAGVVIERVNDSFVSNFLAGEAEPEIVPTSIAEETPTNDYTQVASDAGVEAILDLSVAPDDFHHIILDARNSIDTEGFLGAGDRFVWTFSDGTTAEGIVIEKVFDASGAKSVKLDVIRDGQLVDTLNRDFNIADKTLVELSFEDGIVDTSGYSNRLDQVVSDNLIETATGQGYRIGDNEKLLINRSAEQIHNLETFGVRMEMQVTNPGQPGTFLYFHNVFRASVIDDGFVEFKLTTDTGVYSIRSDQALFQDTETHTIGIGFDGVNGTLELVYDGEVVGQTEAYGTTAPQASFGIVFGHAFSAALPAVVEDFVLSSDPSEAGVVIERVNDSFVSNFLAGEAEPEIVPTSIAEETPTNDYTQVASSTNNQSESLVQPQVIIEEHLGSFVIAPNAGVETAFETLVASLPSLIPFKAPEEFLRDDAAAGDTMIAVDADVGLFLKTTGHNVVTDTFVSTPTSDFFSFTDAEFV